MERGSECAHNSAQRSCLDLHQTESAVEGSDNGRFARRLLEPLSRVLAEPVLVITLDRHIEIEAK